MRGALGDALGDCAAAEDADQYAWAARAGGGTWSIQKGAVKIESECTSITTSIRRLLDQALVSLAGTPAGGDLTDSSQVDGAG